MIDPGSAFAFKLRAQLAHLSPAARAEAMLGYVGPLVAEVTMAIGREKTAECLFALADQVIGTAEIPR